MMLTTINAKDVQIGDYVISHAFKRNTVRVGAYVAAIDTRIRFNNGRSLMTTPNMRLVINADSRKLSV